MKISATLVLSLSLFAAVPAMGAAPGVILKGQIGCGWWTAQRNIKKSEALEQLIVGYLDGLSFAKNTAFWGIGDTDNRAVYSFIDTYCDSNSDKTIFAAANLLFGQRPSGQTH